MSKAVLVDTTLCLYCNACTVECKRENEVPEGFWRTRMEERERGAYPDVKMNFVKRQCMHCEHPACASVCTVGALQKTPEGPVTYDASKCIGCRYCMYACPYGVPKFEWDKPLGLIEKCTFCDHRQAVGLEPACTSACPFGALTFGERDDLIVKAYQRIGEHPDRYIRHVFGEHEGGGISWLYLSSIPFESLGLPELDEKPRTEAAVTVMNATPVTIVVAGAVLGGLYKFAQRREKGLAEKQEQEA